MKTNRNIEAELHARLLAGDPTAPADVAKTFLEYLVRSLTAKYHPPDDTTAMDAATDAIMNYVKNPQSYSPSRAALSTFLYMSAEGDLLNALKSREIRRQKETPTDFVELREDERNNQTRRRPLPAASDPSPIQILITNDLLTKVNKEITDPKDRNLADLLIQGERDTTAYAEVLGITHYAEKEKRKVVKRHKDRISKRLQRLGMRLRDGTD